MDLVYANKVVILYKTKKFKEFLTNINTAISYNSKNKEFIINKLNYSAKYQNKTLRNIFI